MESPVCSQCHSEWQAQKHDAEVVNKNKLPKRVGKEVPHMGTVSAGCLQTEEFLRRHWQWAR